MKLFINIFILLVFPLLISLILLIGTACGMASSGPWYCNEFILISGILLLFITWLISFIYLSVLIIKKLFFKRKSITCNKCNKKLLLKSNIKVIEGKCPNCENMISFK